jgi:hypothetical protein
MLLIGRMCQRGLKKNKMDKKLDNNEWGKWWIYNMDSYRFYSKIVVKKGN